MLFLLNFLHPIIGFAIHLIVRNDFILAFTGVGPSNKFLGDRFNDQTQKNIASIQLGQEERSRDNYHSVPLQAAAQQNLGK